MKLERDTALHFVLLTKPAGNLKLVSDGRGEEARPQFCVWNIRGLFWLAGASGGTVVQPPAQSKGCFEIRGQL